MACLLRAFLHYSPLKSSCILFSIYIPALCGAVLSWENSEGKSLGFIEALFDKHQVFSIRLTAWPYSWNSRNSNLNMLFKFFGQRKHNPPPDSCVPLNPIRNPNSTRCVPLNPICNPNSTCEKSSSLKIIHAGGVVERYYMAVPAARIMEKHPNFILARPEVFRRPWDSVVQPEEILIPGQKYFIVPTRTVKKLRRRMRKPIGENAASLFVSESSIDVSTEDRDAVSSKSFLRKRLSFTKPKAKIKGRSSYGRSGTETKKDSHSVSMEKKGKQAKAGEKKSSIITKSSGSGGMKKVRKSVTWEPSLTMIEESHSSESDE